jgi:pimeloyl-ACP methyl ester carboxylesterase
MTTARINGLDLNYENLKGATRYALEYPYPQSSRAFSNQVRAIRDFNCTRELPAIAAKTLVSAGKEDLLFPPGACAGLAQAIPGATFSPIDDAAHSIHMEQPGPFTEAILDFLMQADGSFCARRIE